SMVQASPNYSTLPNIELKPELHTSIEFGADVRFLDGRLGLDVAYYKTNTRNQILTLAAVKESGVTKQLINAGNIQNQGWEIQLDATPIRTRTVQWNIGANWSRNRGKVKELGNGDRTLTLANGGGWNVIGTPGVIAYEGGAFGAVVVGNGYGTATNNLGRYAVWNNVDDPNDYRNGKQMYYINGSADGHTFGEAGTALSSQYAANAPTNLQYIPVLGNSISGYFGKEASYWGGKEHLAEILGNVEPDFVYGINTSLQVNLPNNSGSFDFFAQIDGRSGGTMVYSLQGYGYHTGNLDVTLYGRDKKHDGVARVNYKGEIDYNGIVPDVVFSNAAGNNTTVISMKTGEEVDLNGMTFKEAVKAEHIQPVMAQVWHYRNRYSATTSVSSQSYMALRELTLGYIFPEKWITHDGLQSSRLTFSPRNVCYIYNGTKWKGNPESFISNNALSPYDLGTTPFVRNFSVNLNLRF
ncbi:MAG: TonB-dependent receptor, partial [Rikenella sp.]|nr:TonB-dependent receptor [Rikenella sp.]